MEITTVHFELFRNNEIFQFHTEFGKLVTGISPAALKIEPLFEKHQAYYKELDEAMLKIAKSAITDEIVAADQRRDSVFRGLVDTVKAALNHFIPVKAAAARRLQIVFNTYGNVSRMTFNEETSAIYNMLQEIKRNNAADIAATDIGDWVDELEAQNNAFGDLVRRRYDETAAKTSLRVKQVRTKIDTAYRDIVRGVEGLALVEGGEAYKDFIKRLNAIVEKYNNLAAQSKRGKSPDATAPKETGEIK
jgi:hypothetical protein